MNLFTKTAQKVNSVLFSVNKSQFLFSPFLYNAAIAITRVAAFANALAGYKKSRPLLQKAAAGSYEVFLKALHHHTSGCSGLLSLLFLSLVKRGFCYTGSKYLRHSVRRSLRLHILTPSIFPALIQQIRADFCLALIKSTLCPHTSPHRC